MEYRLMLPNMEDNLPKVFYSSESAALEAARNAIAEKPSRYILVQHNRPSGKPGWMTVFVAENGEIRESLRCKGMALELLAAIKAGFNSGGRDEWDAPEFEDARLITGYAGASWDFDGWRPILDDLRLHGKVTLGGTVFE